MRTTIVETTITTLPHSVEVPVTIEFADYSDMECMHGHQYIVMHVGNPLQPIKEMTFNPMYDTRWSFSCKCRGDHRMQRGGNTILHDYSLEEAKLYAEMMVEEFKDEVHYWKY